MFKVYWLLLLALLLLPPLSAQGSAWNLVELEELELRPVDIRRMGFAVGGRFIHGDIVEFNRGGADIQVQQDVEDEGQGGFQFLFQYGLDNYVVAGLSIGLRFDYLYVDVRDVELEIFENGILDFAFFGDLLTLHSLSFTPHLQWSVFPLLESILQTDIVPFGDLYFYGGIRCSVNIYDENGDVEDDNLDLDNLETFVLGYEFGIGAEVFLHNFWSLKLEYSYSSQSSDFAIVEGNEERASADLELQVSKLMVGFNYHF